MFTEYIDYLNKNAGALSTVFAGVVMLATVISAILTIALVKETRKLREVQTEPQIEITACPNPQMVSIFTLVVKNIGLGPAYDVSFNLQGESQSVGESELIRDFSKSQFLQRGLKYLGPGQELKSRYTQMTEKYDEKIKARLEISVNYKNANGKSYNHIIPIYFEEFEGYGSIGTPPLFAISKAMDKIENNLSSFVTGFRRLNVDIHSQKDRDNDAEESEKFRQEASEKLNVSNS